MNKIWFTSDHHFGHRNIIDHVGRPFGSVDEMDEMLIQKWNERVAEHDNVYHLGDLGLNKPDQLKEILNRLKGNIFLIKGNHDDTALKCKNRFEWIKDYYELKVPDESIPTGKQKIVLFHYAMRQWNDKFRKSYHLYGHAHGTLPDDSASFSFDIGVDSHNFYPIDYDEVKLIMNRKVWNTADRGINL
ncbi:metallophosphoesterase [Mucilaginibacter myungsuensis]|uniref:Metallophosphoesterase family protein n=1 Tax=Mucilaginibacter myungsuensis TaxID=649104 RepID=A0A929KZT0_9SPHI|nr:metallophosphoesterase [Mucilaginibacter myungsuensis]MBE9660676.1 metallophosphoesterase family protein [Mucilaginibacter myungsuensis]MDN3600721.1 metallophosphoesterase family protein [Mucilaginibacter myungsuensis]